MSESVVVRFAARCQVLFWSLAVAWPCWAGSGGVETLPAFNGQKIKNGITARLDCRWTDGYGYRPVRVTLTVRKTTRDRTIRVVLLPESYSRSMREPLAVTSDIEIPQGEKSVTKTIYVPQQIPWGCFRADFYESGRKLKDLSMSRRQIQWNGRYSNESPCLLMVDSGAPRIDDDRDRIIRDLQDQDSKTLPDINKFQSLMNDHYQRNRVTKFDEDSLRQSGRLSDDRVLTLVQNTPNMEVLPPSDLPTSYVGLAGIDLIIISLADLTETAKVDPERFKAVDYFVRNGGNLFVYAEGETRGRLSGLLDHELVWKAADMRLFRQAVRRSYDELLAEDDNRRRRSRLKPPESAPEFQISQHGLGTIVAIDSVDPYEESAAYWQWTMRSIGFNRLTWSERHGITMVQSNSDYWKFMIPGYGASPVEAFLGVITVFILCIGPLNFFLLNRAKRLYLLPITVAVAALLTTVGMMAYAVVSDGVSTRARLRSFTMLDQTNDQHVASTHCRQAYLAAFVPSAGLVFPRDSCVYPILPHYDRSLEREETVRGEHRVLSRGYLRPRSTTQFLTTAVQQVEHGLDVRQNVDGTIEAAANKFGVPLSHVWIRDGRGELFQAQDVAVDGGLHLEAVGLEAALTQFNEVFARNKPAAPQGLDQAGNGFGVPSYYRYSSRPVYVETSLLNLHMVEATSFFNQPKPDTYLVLSPLAPPFVRTGTQAEEIAGFHVIRGEW